MSSLLFLFWVDYIAGDRPGFGWQGLLVGFSGSEFWGFDETDNISCRQIIAFLKLDGRWFKRRATQ